MSATEGPAPASTRGMIFPYYVGERTRFAGVLIPPDVRSAEEWPEVPGARIVVQPEGGILPSGYWRVLSRVLPNLRDADNNGWDILLVAPWPSQAWWERYAPVYERTYMERWREWSRWAAPAIRDHARRMDALLARGPADGL